MLKESWENIRKNKYNLVIATGVKIKSKAIKIKRDKKESGRYRFQTVTTTRITSWLKTKTTKRDNIKTRDKVERGHSPVRCWCLPWRNRREDTDVRRQSLVTYLGTIKPTVPVKMGGELRGVLHTYDESIIHMLTDGSVTPNPLTIDDETINYSNLF